ncbi:hypothetical protein, partial [Streptomyces sp. NPDC056401]|uniref:hypothetical protein n=1 Tax=Streptomyces sp. NPDC056401 TaxID=3345809 RepID=UPI0035DD2201
VQEPAQRGRGRGGIVHGGHAGSPSLRMNSSKKYAIDKNNDKEFFFHIDVFYFRKCGPIAQLVRAHA